MENLGPSSLARRAGIKPPSIFKHFTGKTDIELRLIEYGFGLFTIAVQTALANTGEERRDRAAAFAGAYRNFGLQHPQLYRLMNNRPLPRAELDPEAEAAAMVDILELIPNMDVARSVWSWAHGMLSLELADRYPHGADLDAAWAVLVDFVAQPVVQ